MYSFHTPYPEIDLETPPLTSLFNPSSKPLDFYIKPPQIFKIQASLISISLDFRVLQPRGKSYLFSLDLSLYITFFSLSSPMYFIFGNPRI